MVPVLELTCLSTFRNYPNMVNFDVLLLAWFPCWLKFYDSGSNPSKLTVHIVFFSMKWDDLWSSMPLMVSG